MKSMFEMLDGYNAWANRQLYDAATELDDADYRADHGAFFSSVHGTLNHLLVAIASGCTALPAKARH